MQVVFAESELGLVASLARWISPPAAAAAGAKPAAADDDAAAAPVTPSAFEAECTQLEAKGDFKGLSAKLRPALKERLAGSAATDVQNAYAILFDLLLKWKLMLGGAAELAEELAGSSPKEQAASEQELRSALLLSLYGVVQQHGDLPLRFSLLLRLIKFCAEVGALGKVLGEVDERIERVERWVAEWKLTEEQQKELWGVIFDAHAADSRTSFECALKYFSLHKAADLSSQASLKERLVQGLLITVRSPDLFRCDELSQLAVVQQLSSDAKLAPLHELLGTMARGTYAEYLAFSKGAPAQALLKEHALPVDALATKMRLLTLVSLGHASKELSYKAIAEALQVQVSDVEAWVLQAIASGLMTAKMDQVRETVAISMCAERDFGKQQWERLHGSLVDWRDSIRSLLEVMKSSRPSA